MFITTKNIVILLEQRNISANKLAIECELSNSAITEWKKGKSNPSTKALEKIAAFFNLPLSYFYSEHTNAEIPILPDAMDNGEIMTTVEKIQKLLDERKISAYKLSLEIGLNKTFLTDWKSGKAKPSADALTKIADYFNVSVDYLLGRAEIPLPLDAIPVSGEFMSLPVIGTITAGYDGMAQEEFTGEYLDIPREILTRYSRDELYVLTVKGDSMYPELLDGDKVLVYRTDSVDSGTVAVVLYSGDAATVKRVEYEQGKDYVDLIPRNPEYKTKRIEGADLEQCRILGKVIYLFRKF